MANSYQVNVTAAGRATIADFLTKTGGARVTIVNSHATEPLYIGGEENEKPGGTAGTLSASTGMKIAAGAVYTTIIDSGETIYGLSGTSTVSITVHVFRTNPRV